MWVSGRRAETVRGVVEVWVWAVVLRSVSVVNAVFPPPLGPTSKKVGTFVDAAAFLYRKVWNSIGSAIATRTVIKMVVGFGEKAAVSQLS